MKNLYRIFEEVLRELNYYENESNEDFIDRNGISPSERIGKAPWNKVYAQLLGFNKQDLNKVKRGIKKQCEICGYYNELFKSKISGKNICVKCDEKEYKNYIKNGGNKTKLFISKRTQNIINVLNNAKRGQCFKLYVYGDSDGDTYLRKTSKDWDYLCPINDTTPEKISHKSLIQNLIEESDEDDYLKIKEVSNKTFEKNTEPWVQ